MATILLLLHVVKNSAQIQIFGSQILKLVLCLSLAIPSIGLRPAAAQELSPLKKKLTELEDMYLEIADIESRVVRHGIARATIKTQPTFSDVIQLQTELLKAKDQLKKDFWPQLLSAKSTDDQKARISDINVYFEAVRRVEGLKIFMGEKVEPDKWNAMYALTFPIETVPQHTFMLVSALYSVNSVDLPGSVINFEEIRKVLTHEARFQTSMQRGTTGWELTFNVNPAFAQEYEMRRLVEQPSTDNVLQFALMQLTHMNYESLAASFMHLRRPLSQLPAPSAMAQQRFVSMRVKRQQLLQIESREIAAKRKLVLLKGVIDSLDAMYKANRGYVNDEKFLEFFDVLRNLDREKDKIPEALKAFQKDERTNFESALISLLLLMPMDKLSDDITFLISEAKRMALRWQLLLNPKEPFQMSEEDRANLSEEIDRRADLIAAEVMASEPIEKAILTDLNSKPLTEIRNAQRNEMQNRMVEHAQQFEKFENKEINLTYLIEAQEASIKKLQPSATVLRWLKMFGASSDYRLGHIVYQTILLQYLSAFQFPKPPRFKLKSLLALKGQFKWNSEMVRTAVSQKHFEALERHKDERVKDLEDLLAIGELLKFDKLEDLPLVRVEDPAPYPVYKLAEPTVEHLDVKNTAWFSWFRGTERERYLKAMTRDILTASPLLGGTVDQTGKTVWKQLLEKETEGRNRFDVVEKQLLKVERQVLDNQSLLDRELANLSTNNNAKLENVSEELRVLITRTTGLALSLSSYASFQSYFEQIRMELLIPGFWEQRFKYAGALTTQVWMAAAALLVGKLLLSRVRVVKAFLDGVDTILAPVVGGGFARLNYLILGMFGVSTGLAAYRGWGPEATRTEILRRFYEEGVDRAGIAQYKNLDKQTEIRDKARWETKFNVGLMLLLQAGVYAFRPWAAQRAAQNFKKLQDDLLPHAENIGLNATSNLSKENIQLAVNQAVHTASGGDELVAALTQVRVRQSQFFLEREIYQLSMKWNAIDRRFAKYFGRLAEIGLNKRSWKNIENLKTAMKTLEWKRDQGILSAGEARELEHVLHTMLAEVQPVSAQFANHPFLRNLMERVWDTSMASDVQIKASIEWFGKRLIDTSPFQELVGVGGKLGQNTDDVVHRVLSEVKSGDNWTDHIQFIRKLQDQK